MKVGIVGCGFVTQSMHLPNLIELIGRENISLCDISKDLLEKVSKKYGISSTHATEEDLVTRRDIDAVMICTPDALHFAGAMNALKEGKHVFVEKPLCLASRDSSRLIETAKESNLILQVGYNKRFNPGYMAGKQEFQGMKDIILIRVHNLVDNRRIAKELYQIETGTVPEEAGAAISKETERQIQLELGDVDALSREAYLFLLFVTSHYLDALRGIFGDPASALYTDVWKVRGKVNLVSTLLYPNGTRCNIESGAETERKHRDDEICAYSPDETVRLIWANPFIKNSPAIVKVQRGDRDITDVHITASYEDSYKLELVDFLKCIKDKKNPVVAGEDGAKVISIACAIVQSFNKNRSVLIESGKTIGQ